MKRKYLLTRLMIGALLLLAVIVSSQITPNPGHSAASIRAGTLSQGDYRFTGILNATKGIITTNVTADRLQIQNTLFSNKVNITGTIRGVSIINTGKTNVSGTIYTSNISASQLLGAGLGSCSGTSQKLQYNTSNGFSCGTDASGSISCVFREYNSGGGSTAYVACQGSERITGGGCNYASSRGLTSISCPSTGSGCITSGTPTGWYCQGEFNQYAWVVCCS